MISMRLKKFYKKTGRKLQFDAKEPVGFDKAKVECYNCHKTGHFARECRSKGNQDSRRRDAGYTSHSEDEQENYALMAYSNSGSDTEYRNSDIYSSFKESRSTIVAHQQNQLWYEKKIRFMKIDLDDKTDVLTYHKKLLAEAEKEKEELKAKVEKWHNSSKNLNILLTKGMHAVPPPITRIYIPSGPDVEIDESQFTYGPKQSKPSESDARSSDFNSCESNTSEETLTSMPEPVFNEPKVVSQPKVWSDAPIIDFSHLIRDCDFHEKRMAKQAELNKRMCKGTGKKENKPVWNNVQRVNHQNQFVPKAVLTRTGRIPVNTARASSTNNVNTARHNFNRHAVLTNAARKVNTVKPIVNDVRPKTIFHKSHSPIRRPFKSTTAPKTNLANQKVNTAGDKAVSDVGGIRKTVVKPSADCVWRP
ncbi:ribonuclease H-like domain-containing protein [Tanacetum coccineum]